MPRIDLFPLAVITLATIAASVTDIWKFKVYNALTLPLFLLGVAVSTLLGGWQGLGSSVAGAGLGFLFLFFLFAMGGVGAGDVKLLAAVGSWLGPFLTYQVFVASGLFAALYAIVLIVLRGGPMAVFAEFAMVRSALTDPRSWKRAEVSMAQEVRRPDRRRRLVPFAAMICAGYLATMAWWHSDLGRVWPPYDRPAPSLTTLHPESELEAIR